MERASEDAAKAWTVYMVRCADGSLYTGITTDVARRVREHNEGRAGARYTRSRRPVVLVFHEASAGRGEALRRERAIKGLTRAEKLALLEATKKVK